MNTHLIESSSSHAITIFHTELEERPPRRMSRCYKAQLFCAITSFAGGLSSATIGIPALLRNLLETEVTMTGGVDPSNFSFSGKVVIIDKDSELMKYGILSVTGIFLIIFTTGLLLGMVTQKFR